MAVAAAGLFIPAEEFFGTVAGGAPTGGVPRAVVVAGATVAVVVVVECSPPDYKIFRPNRAFNTSLEIETENEQGDGGIASF